MANGDKAPRSIFPTVNPLARIAAQVSQSGGIVILES